MQYKHYSIFMKNVCRVINGLHLSNLLKEGEITRNAVFYWRQKETWEYLVLFINDVVQKTVGTDQLNKS